MTTETSNNEPSDFPYEDEDVIAILIDGSHDWDYIVEGSYKPSSFVLNNVEVAYVTAIDKFTNEHYFLYPDVLRAVKFLPPGEAKHVTIDAEDNRVLP